MSKFSSGSTSSNDAIIREQQRQEQTAKRNTDNKNERLREGRERIRAMFSEDGGTYDTARTWEPRDAQGPEYITRRTSSPWGNFSVGARGPGADPFFSRLGGGRNPAYTTERVRNPDYVPAGYDRSASQTKSVQGIGQDFYDNFKSSILDFYMPEVERQHREAKSQNLFNLARRGLLRSSEAADSAGDLVRERAQADATVKADAEGQTSNLRSDVSRAKQNALSLLQSTEDPTTAANAAASEVNAIQSRAPRFDELGSLFSSALNAVGSYRDAQNARRGYEAIVGRGPYESSGRRFG